MDTTESFMKDLCSQGRKFQFGLSFRLSAERYEVLTRNVFGYSVDAVLFPVTVMLYLWENMSCATLFGRMVIHSTLSEMKNKILPTCLQRNYRDSLGELSNTACGMFAADRINVYSSRNLLNMATREKLAQVLSSLQSFCRVSSI